MEKPDKVILLRTTGTEVALSADAAKLPKRIKILNWGDNPNCHGQRVNVGPLFAKCLAAATYPYRKVALDFEHNTFPGTAAYKESSEPRPVAGFGTVEVVEGKGVYLTMSAWTPDGEKNAVNFADVSAGAVTDKDGNVVAVASVALCRAGAVDGMDFVEAPLSGGVSSALSIALSDTQARVPAGSPDGGQFAPGGGGNGPSVTTGGKPKAAKSNSPDSFNAALKKAKAEKNGAAIVRAHMAALKAGFVWNKSKKQYVVSKFAK